MQTATSTTQSQSDLTIIREAVKAGRSPAARKLMQIPERYRHKAMPDTPQAGKALEALEAGRSIFLAGVAGSGKTHLAVVLMSYWFAERVARTDEGVIYCREGYPVFLPVAELLLEIKASWEENERWRADSEQQILEKYTRTPLLVLDDLGAEKASEWSRSVLYLLLDRRYRDMKQTIVTSNLELGEIAEQVDARIASRLAEMGAVIDMGDKDHRLRR